MMGYRITRVVLLPSGLRWALAALLLTLPFAATEVLVVARSLHVFELRQKIAAAAIAAAVVFLPQAWSFARGRKWVLRALEASAALWCIVNFWMAARMRHTGLGFFTVGLLVYWLLLRSWIAAEISRSFFDPALRWYQGAPKPISGLKCYLIRPDSRAEARVSRIDREGAFVVSPELVWVRTPEPVELLFQFRDREALCKGVPVKLVASEAIGQAAGVKFCGMTADARKKLGDLVEMLRGEGYVG